jgi:hypothetical protein
MGEMKRANAYEEQRRMTDRFASTHRHLFYGPLHQWSLAV